jgi:putative transcriptional regulator
MSKKAFDRIAAGLDEALAIARGEKKPAKLFVPAELDVKAIRAKIDLSQEDFAAAYGFSSNQIKDWEQGRSRPLGALRAYLMMIDYDPKYVLEMLKVASGKSKRVAA